VWQTVPEQYCAVLWDAEGTVRNDSMPQVVTIVGVFVANLLCKLLGATKEKLLHNNASARRSPVVQAAVPASSFEEVHCLSLSFVLPVDYCLYPYLNKHFHVRTEILTDSKPMHALMAD